MNKLSYTIAIATRNRPAALRLSIPRMLEQSRPPSQLIVIDSSDDHQETVDAVKDSVREFPIDLTILPSERGLTLQRNASLPLIKHLVVFFPDDDSIWFPEVAAAKMDVYERDDDKRIAAVCGAESPTPPPGWQVPASGAYSMRSSHRFQQRFAYRRSMLEDRFFPDPARVLGQSLMPQESELPEWFAEEDVVPVEWMTGFRMSFRTEVIRKVRFDELLSRYSVCEDLDASFGAWRYGMVVGARKARIYHYRSPERRDNGRRYGATHLLNKAYVICKHAEAGEDARGRVMASARYKTFLYWLAQRDEFGKERYLGAREALKGVRQLVAAGRSDAEGIYKVESSRLE